MADYEIQLQTPLVQTLKKKIAPFSLEVGILKDEPHRNGRGKTGLTVAEVSKEVRKKLRLNYLTEPWKGTRKNRDQTSLMTAFWAMVFGRGKLRSKTVAEKHLRSVVRRPLSEGKYGRNKFLRKLLGRDQDSRKFISSGQLFRAIRARIRVNGVP